MASAKDSPETIMAQAKALIDRVQGNLAAGEALLCDQGLDPEKIRETMEDHLTLQGRLQAQQAFQADMAAVEQEVREEAARLSFAAPTVSNSVRRRRPMI